MKAIVFFLVGMLLMTISWSQQSIDWKKVLGKGSVAELNLFLDSTQLEHKSSYFDYYNRTLTTSFNERVICFEDYYEVDSTTSSSHYDVYHISIIQSNDTIAFAKITSVASIFQFDKEEGDSVYQFESLEQVKKVKDEFRQIYHAKLQWDELFNTSIKFGLWCGRTSFPFPTEEHAKISNYVYKKRINKLRQYLTSTCLEKQFFGIQGFFELKEDGYKIKPSHKALIDTILAKQGEVIYCSGCGVARMEVSVFKGKFIF